MNEEVMAFNTRENLTEGAYANDAKLGARQAIYAFRQPPVDVLDWACDLYPWRGDEVVLDVGCGNGAYERRLEGRVGRMIAVDLSLGMLTTLSSANGTAAPLVNADAQALPLASASIDVGLAMHMLYHVPDQRRAVHELRRVIRPGGTLMALTNADGHTAQIDELLAEAVSIVCGRVVPRRPRADSTFTLEAAPGVLGAAFDDIEVHQNVGELVVPEARPVVDYLHSLVDWAALYLPDPTRWEATMREAETLVEDRIRAEGAFRVTTASGVVLAR